MLPPSAFNPPTELALAAEVGPDLIIPSFSIPDRSSSSLRGRSYRTADTWMTRGLNSPRESVSLIHLGLRYPLAGVLRDPGIPIVFGWTDRTGEAVTAVWGISIYRSARVPTDPHWFHRSLTPGIRFSGNITVADTLFSFPSEEVFDVARAGGYTSWATIHTGIVAFDEDDRAVGRSNIISVFRVEFNSSPGVMVPTVGAMRPLESSLYAEEVAMLEVGDGVDTLPVTVGLDASPAVLIDPLPRG